MSSYVIARKPAVAGAMTAAPASAPATATAAAFGAAALRFDGARR
ncbi:hypothetical protein [Streptacidiphilus sp. PAMC 29251]